MPAPSADGTPRFERYVGVHCARAIDRRIWCQAADHGPFSRMDYPENTLATVDNAGIRYLLSSSGDVFRTGRFVPQSPAGKALDYPKPVVVDGLRDVTEMIQHRDHVFVRRRNGVVESWWNDVVTDDDGLTIRMEESPRKVAAPERFERMFIGEGECFDSGRKIHCLSSGVETYDRSFALPLPYPSTEVAAVAVRGHLCVLKKSGEARCIKDPLGKDPKLGLSGVEELMVNAERVPHRFVDMIDTLWGFVAVDDERELWLFNPELKNFGLTKLAAFRKVRDFSQFPCVVSIDGRLRCHDPHVSFGDSTSDGRDVMSDEPLALP